MQTLGERQQPAVALQQFGEPSAYHYIMDAATEQQVIYHDKRQNHLYAVLRGQDNHIAAAYHATEQLEKKAQYNALAAGCVDALYL